jgi:hypothetical protein
MQETVSKTRSGDEPDPDTAAFYRQVLEILNASSVPYLLGGAYAFNRYTGINRHTSDLDIFIRRCDYERLSSALLQGGYETELTYPHWLGKIHYNGVYIDLIFSSGNGIAEVDDEWFDNATDTRVLDVSTRICPAEEMIWSKAFIMERERYDGADVVHLLRACGNQLDWQRLMRRFDPHWRILLSHLILFGFVYPADRGLIPLAVMDDLLSRLRHEIDTVPPQDSVCLGTLLSREQYLNDIEQQGFQDARIAPRGNMTANDTARWTQAIPNGHRS